MQLFEFTSQGFRNLSPDPVSFGAGVTLITGENAQGKTNLLEAVSLLCGQRSFRGAISGDMARGGGRFAIEGTVEGRSGSERIGVSWSREEGRAFTRGAKPAGFREISQLAPAVFLAPEHQELVTGAPSARRRFLDRLVLGLKPAAGDDLVRYSAALRERNALLARWKSGAAGSAGELDAWTEELVIAGSAVRRHRIAALAAWEADFRQLARDRRRRLRRHRGGLHGRRRLGRCDARRRRARRGPRAAPRLHAGRTRSATISSGSAAAARSRPRRPRARSRARSRWRSWRSGRPSRRRAGEPPLFGADDFDAGLSEASVEEFFETLPSNAAVLLTTAAPSARWSRRAAAVLEVRGGAVAVAVPRALRAVGAGQGVR